VSHDLPSHFAARIDKGGGGCCKRGDRAHRESRISANGDSCCAMLENLTNTAAGDAHFWAEGMKSRGVALEFEQSVGLGRAEWVWRFAGKHAPPPGVDGRGHIGAFPPRWPGCPVLVAM